MTRNFSVLTEKGEKMRLIDADELKDWIAGWFETNKYYHPYSKSNNIPTTELYDLLDRIPTIEPKQEHWVPTAYYPNKEDIIRCKDCIHCIDTDKYCACMYWCSDTKLDGFCHKGERKEE